MLLQISKTGTGSDQNCAVLDLKANTRHRMCMRRPVTVNTHHSMTLANKWRTRESRRLIVKLMAVACCSRALQLQMVVAPLSGV